MLKIDRQNKSFSRLEAPSLANAAITERYHLQEYICNSPDAFFQEIGQRLFLIDKEVLPSEDVDDRIDLLALDEEGHTVIIELKRGNHKLQLFQAISYAAMIASWGSSDFLTDLTSERIERLKDFLAVEIDEINRHQRIILVAEDFDYSVLVGAEWLNQKYEVDIICCRISLAQDAVTNAEFLVCSNIFPAPEVAEQAVQRGQHRPGGRKSKWPDWDTVLAAVTNPAIVNYFRGEIEAKRDNHVPRRSLRYRIQNKRRWSVKARSSFAHVSQYGRFEGDVDFWRSGLSQPKEVVPITNDTDLRFRLYTEKDCQFFHQAATDKLLAANWNGTGSDDDNDQ